MIEVSLEGLDRAFDRLERVSSPAQRKKILRKVGRQVLKNARQRTRNQVDLNGNPFKDHARGRKRKMLTRLTRAKNMNIVALSSEKLIVGFKNRFLEILAAKQQYGFTQNFTAAQMRQRNSNVGNTTLASRRQAKALIAAGYKVKRESGGYKTPSITWITQNMKVGRAGAILRALRGGGAVSAWDTTLPKRSFLGITSDEVIELSNLVKIETRQLLERNNA